MRMRHLAVLVVMAGVAHPAWAANLPGHSCAGLGTTQLAEDKSSIVACLKVNEVPESLKWKSMTPFDFSTDGYAGIGTTAPADKLHVAGGNLRVGEINPFNFGSFPGYGRALNFSGGPGSTLNVNSAFWGSENSDLLWMARYNVARDVSELRVNIGDNLISSSDGSDAFVVGTNYYADGVWHPTLRVQADQKVIIYGDVDIGMTNPTGKFNVYGNGVSLNMRSDVGASKLNNMISIGVSNATTGGDSSRIEFYGPNGRDGLGSLISNRIYYSADKHLFRGKCPACSPYVLTIDAIEGKVGINTLTPQYSLDVNGTAYVNGAPVQTSDKRRKDDIKALALSGLEIVDKLRPVSFKWKEPKDDGMKGDQLGFIAQDVEEILPQAVLTGKDAEKTKGLKYDSFIPVLTKAIQELKAENTELRQRLEQLEKSAK